MNNDGSVIVGFGNSTPSNGQGQAYVWTASTGKQLLEFLPDGVNKNEANGVSGDGSIIVGNSTRNHGGVVEPRAVYWNVDRDIVELGDLFGSSGNGRNRSHALATNHDGSIIVGASESPESGSNAYQAFRWTENAGMHGIGDLPGGTFESMAMDLSSDGSVIVGFGSCASGREACIWTEAGQIRGLGDLAGGSFQSQANGVSADGRIVVGVGRVGTDVAGDRAFVWTESWGMRSLQDVLTGDFGLDLTGWTLRRADGISDDGTRIVGYGINPQGRQEAFIAVIPSPGAAYAIGLACISVVRRRR